MYSLTLPRYCYGLDAALLGDSVVNITVATTNIATLLVCYMFLSFSFHSSPTFSF